MNVVRVVDLRNTPDDVGRCSDGAVKRLLDVTEHPKIERWIQFPKALFVFLVVPEDPESGAFYVYDRRGMLWFWLDFDDEKFGGYTVSDFDRLVRSAASWTSWSARSTCGKRIDGSWSRVFDRGKAVGLRNQ